MTEVLADTTEQSITIIDEETEIKQLLNKLVTDYYSLLSTQDNIEILESRDTIQNREGVAKLRKSIIVLLQNYCSKSLMENLKQKQGNYYDDIYPAYIFPNICQSDNLKSLSIKKDSRANIYNISYNIQFEDTGEETFFVLVQFLIVKENEKYKIDGIVLV